MRWKQRGNKNLGEWHHLGFCWWPRTLNGTTYWLERPPLERRLIRTKRFSETAICAWEIQPVVGMHIDAPCGMFKLDTREFWKDHRHKAQENYDDMPTGVRSEIPPPPQPTPPEYL